MRTDQTRLQRAPAGRPALRGIVRDVEYQGSYFLLTLQRDGEGAGDDFARCCRKRRSKPRPGRPATRAFVRWDQADAHGAACSVRNADDQHSATAIDHDSTGP